MGRDRVKRVRSDRSASNSADLATVETLDSMADLPDTPLRVRQSIRQAALGCLPEYASIDLRARPSLSTDSTPSRPNRGEEPGLTLHGPDSR